MDFDLNQIHPEQGLYLFFTTTHALYAGESSNLQNRLRKHLDHSDNKGLARWLWERETEKLHVEIRVLAETTTLPVRRALESELIQSHRPIFNVQTWNEKRSSANSSAPQQQTKHCNRF